MKTSEQGTYGNSTKKCREPEKWCELHQQNTHNTSEYKVLLAQAQRMHGMWEAKLPTGKKPAHQGANGKPFGDRKKPPNMQEKQAFNTDLKKLIREQLKEIMNTETEQDSTVNDNFNIDDFQDLQLSEEENETEETDEDAE